MTYFVSLKITAIVIGLIYVLSSLPAVLSPGWFAPRLRALPRNFPVGAALMLAATAWFVVLTGVMDLGELSNTRTTLMMVWGAAGVLTVIFVRGFLAMRALGCLLLLAAALVLDAAFLVQTPWRYVMTVMAYLWAIGGMVLVYSPHLGRNMIDFAAATPERLRFFSVPKALFGLLLIVLGIFVYP